MAKTYTFRVTSEGVDELRTKLESLGPAGAKAFDSLVQSAPGLARPIAAAEAAADQLRGKLDKLAQQQEAAARTSINQQAKAREAEQWLAMLDEEAAATERSTKARERNKAVAEQAIATYAPEIAQARALQKVRQDLDGALKAGAITQADYGVVMKEVIKRQDELGASSGRTAGQVRQAHGIIASNLLNIGNVAIATKGNIGSMVTPLPDVIYGLKMAGGATMAWGLGLVTLTGILALTLGRVVSLKSELKQLEAAQAAYNNQTMTGPQAQSAAHAMADNSPWFSRSDADAAIAELTKFRTLSAEILRDIQDTAADFGHVTGKDLAAGGKELADSFSKGYAGIKQLNDAYGFLEPQQMAQIRALSEQGKHAEAARIAMAALSEQMHRAADLSKGAAAEGFQDMAAAWNKALDAMARSPGMQVVLSFLTRMGNNAAIDLGGEDQYTAAQKRLAKARYDLEQAQKGHWYNYGGVGLQTDIDKAQKEYDSAAAEMDRQVESARAEAGKRRIEQGEQDSKSADQAAKKDRENADELTASYQRQTTALGSNAAARERLQVLQAADEKFRDKPNSDLEKQAYIAGELSKLAAERLGSSRDQVRASEAETKAADQVSSAFGRSAQAGYAEQVQQQAAVIALTKRIPLEQALAEAKSAFAQQVAQQVAQQAQAQAGYGAEEEALRRVADAAKASVDGEHQAQDAAQASAKYADLLAKARVSGAALEVTAVESMIEVEKAHLAVMRSLNAEADANRQLRQGKIDNAIGQSEIDMIRAGVRPEDRERVLQFERDRQRIIQDTADIQDESVRTQKRAELEAQARLSADQAAARKFWGEVESFVQDITTTMSSNIADAIIEGGDNGMEQLKKALLRTALTIPINLVAQQVVAPMLMQGASAVVSGLGFGAGASGGGMVGSAQNAGSAIATQAGGGFDYMGAGSLGLNAYKASGGGGGFISNAMASGDAWFAGSVGGSIGASSFQALASSGQVAGTMTAADGSLQAVLTNGNIVNVSGLSTLSSGSIAGTMTAADGSVMAVTTSGEIVPMTSIAGTSMASTPSTFTGTLGTGGTLLAGAGTVLNNVMAWQQGTTQGLVTSGFTAAGAVIGSMFPVVGTMLGAAIGSTIGSLVSSLFGGGDSEPKEGRVPGNATRGIYIDKTTGKFAADTELWGKREQASGDGGGPDALSSLIDPTLKTADSLNKTIELLGLTINKDAGGGGTGGLVALGAGWLENPNHQGNMATLYGGRSNVYTDPQALALAVLRNTDLVGATGLVATARANSKATTLDEFATDLGFAKQLQASKDSLIQLVDIIGNLRKAAHDAVTNGLDNMVKGLQKARDLGIEGAWRSVTEADIRRQFTEQAAVAQPTATEQQIAKAMGTIDGLAEAVKTLGLGITDAEISGFRSTTLANIKSGFDKSINAQLLAITNPQQQALGEWSDWADTLRKEATAAGADMVKVEELIAEKRKAILADQLSATEKTAADIKQWLQQQQLGALSSLSSPDKLAAAQGQFSAAIAAARGGDATALSGLTQNAQALLTAGRDMYASGANYTALEGWVKSTLTNVAHDLGLPGFAYGGVSAGKQLAWVSEGPWTHEAHVPLPNGRSIPVTINGGGDGMDVSGLRSDLREIGAILMRVQGVMESMASGQQVANDFAQKTANDIRKLNLRLMQG